MKIVLKKRQGKLALPATAVLSAVPDELLHHRDHRLRHPLGVYNNSVGSVVERLSRVLEPLRRPPPAIREVPPGGDDWREGLLERLDAFLDSMMEHFDDCLNVLKCFFVSANARNRNDAVKRYKQTIGVHRKHIGELVNHIKHEQGRLRFFVMSDKKGPIPGYFAEAVNAEGALAPHERLHPDATAFSFNRDLRYHVATLLVTSQSLAGAVQSIAGVVAPAGDQGTAMLSDVVHSVAALPARVYPDELQKAWPSVVMKRGKKNKPTTYIVEYPSKQESVTVTGLARYGVAYAGDGTTRSFVTPYMAYLQRRARRR